MLTASCHERCKVSDDCASAGAHAAKNKTKANLFMMGLNTFHNSGGFYNSSVGNPDNPLPVSCVFLRMRHLKYCDGFFVQLLKYLHDLPSLIRMQVAGRLVSKQKLGPPDNRAGNAHELLLSATKLFGKQVLDRKSVV